MKKLPRNVKSYIRWEEIIRAYSSAFVLKDEEKIAYWLNAMYAITNEHGLDNGIRGSKTD